MRQEWHTKRGAVNTKNTPAIKKKMELACVG